MTDPDMRLGLRVWGVAGILLAAMVHIASVLAMPRLAPGDAFMRLAPLGPLNAFHPLPRTAPGSELVPYDDPAFATGACRYDLADGPLHVRGKLVGDGFVSLSFHDRRGLVYYTLTDKSTTARDFDVLLLTADQLSAVQAADADQSPPPQLRVTSPGRKGFVFGRALAPQPSAYEEAAGQISALSCTIEPQATR